MTLRIAVILMALSLLPGCFLGCAVQRQEQPVVILQGNKTVPKVFAEEAAVALSYYPDLRLIPITFEIKDRIRNSYMQAQPDLKTILSGNHDRAYNIFISRKLLQKAKGPSPEIPSNVIVGWFGHELGHIADYRNRSALGMAIFGLRYLGSKQFLQRTETRAEVYAVQQGMLQYLLATKRYIHDSPDFSQDYKDKIQHLYPSPEELRNLIQDGSYDTSHRD